MATYDIDNLPSGYRPKTGDIINCPYKGAAKSRTLTKGTYKLEVWGAQGGSYSTTYYGGKGGYSVGVLTITTDTLLHLYVGGKGSALTSNASTTTKQSGGFNGGGAGVRASGGGASDIRIGTDSLYARVIVAGGGGGSGYFGSSYYGIGGAGGGTNGIAGNYNGSTNTTTAGQGASQTSGGVAGTGTSNQGTAGSFGLGGDSHTQSGYYGGAGGGGWYGGGGASFDSSGAGEGGGGGGSGYIYTASTASNYPSGCLLNSSYYLTNASTTDGQSSFISPSGSTETGHTGDGYVRITVIKAGGAPSVNIGGSWKEGDSLYVNIGGSWKEADSIYCNIGGSWKELS